MIMGRMVKVVRLWVDQWEGKQSIDLTLSCNVTPHPIKMDIGIYQEPPERPVLWRMNAGGGEGDCGSDVKIETINGRVFLRLLYPY